MPDKQLTEAAWKTFAKGGPDYKDAPLLKALAALDKAEKSGPSDELEALDEIEKQATTLAKANKSDKKLESYLSDLDKALVKQRKASEKARDEAAKQAAAEEEDEESPALLTSKLIPLIRQVRKGDTVLQALIAIAGKDTAVLLSRRSISPARGKLLKEYLGASGGLKFVRGECLFEENAITFVVQSQAAGLAKKLKAALLLQTEMRLKVRVRGEDPDDLDEEGEEGDEGDQPAPAGSSSSAPGAPQTDAPKEKAPDPQQALYEARMAKVEASLQLALKQQAGDVSKMRAVSAFVQEKAGARLYAAALQGLDMLEKLLAAAGVSAAASGAGADKPVDPGTSQRDKGVDPAAGFTARMTALLPAIKEAIAAAGPQAQDIKLKASEAGALARGREFDPAHALLDEVEKLLAGKGSEGASGAEASPDAATYAQRLEQTRTRLETALSGKPADAAKLSAILEHAVKQADAGALAKALAALDQLDKVLDSRPTGGATLVPYRKSLLDFRTAAAKVKGQVKALQTALPQALPAWAELADELSEVLESLVDDVLNEVDKQISDPAQAPELAKRLDALMAELAGNEIIKAADKNPFTVPMSVETTLYGALAAVRKALPLPA